MRSTILLSILMMASVAWADSPRIQAEKAHKICERIVELANSGALVRSIASLERLSLAEREKWDEERKARRPTTFDYPDAKLLVDLDGDGRPSILYRMVGGGTCHSFTFVEGSRNSQLPIGYDSNDPDYIGVGDEMAIESDDDLRWAGWGTMEYFVSVLGEPIVVSGLFGGSRTRLKLASWFREGRKRPLCAFDPTYNVRSKVKLSHDRQLCRAAASNKLKQIATTQSEETTAKLRELGLRLDEAHTAVIDLNGDGARDGIAVGVYNSGAGCGRDGITSIHVMDEGFKSFRAGKLQEALEGEWGPLPYGATANDLAAKLVTFNRKTYIVGAAPTGIGIYSVAGDERRQLCEIAQTPQFKIRKYFPLRFE